MDATPPRNYVRNVAIERRPRLHRDHRSGRKRAMDMVNVNRPLYLCTGTYHAGLFSRQRCWVYDCNERRQGTKSRALGLREETLMKARSFRHAFVIAMLLANISAPAQARAPTLVSIQTPRGATQAFILWHPSSYSPVATVQWA